LFSSPCLFLSRALEPKSNATHLMMRCQSSRAPQATPLLATAVSAVAEQATCAPCMGGDGTPPPPPQHHRERSPASPSAHPFEIITSGKFSSPSRRSLFIFLLAERALCTLCMQEEIISRLLCMHSNQSWVFSSTGRNISPAHAAGLSPALLTEGWNISPAHAAVLSPASWLGQYRPSPVHFIFSFFLFVLCLYIYIY